MAALTQLMSCAVEHIADTTILREACCSCGPADQARGDLNQERWRVRNDELLISRQARALAEAASIIRSLESALGRALNARIEPLTPTVQAPDVAAPGIRIERTDESFAQERVTLLKLVVLPTVYTNVGSLLDIFA